MHRIVLEPCDVRWEDKMNFANYTLQYYYFMHRAIYQCFSFSVLKILDNIVLMSTIFTERSVLKFNYELNCNPLGSI
jgi:hypothetical protein